MQFLGGKISGMRAEDNMNINEKFSFSCLMMGLLYLGLSLIQIIFHGIDIILNTYLILALTFFVMKK